MKPVIRQFASIMLFTFLLISSFASSSNAQTDNDSIRAEIHLMIEQADSLSEAALYDSAIVVGKQALGNAETEFGIEDTTSALALHRLGVYYYHKAEYDEAQVFLERALTIREKVLGPEHLDVATSLNNIGILCVDQGDYTEAEEYYKRALAIREKALGPEHAKVANSFSRLAILYWHLSKHTEALYYQEHALAIRKKIFGPEHRDVAISLNNMAAIYQDQGKYSEAEPLFKKALEIREKVLGPENKAVGETLNNIGIIYYLQGRYAEAEPYFKKALAVREKVLGPEHPVVADNLHNLMAFYWKQAKYTEAEIYLRRALAIREKVFHSNHPAVALSFQALGVLYSAQGKYAEAELFNKRALTINEKAFGPEHPRTVQSLENLGTLYGDQGKYVKAEPLFKRALAIREKVLGPEHPDIARSLNNLATFYEIQGKYTEAEQLYKRALAIGETALGPEHTDVASTLKSLATLHNNQGKYAEAEGLYMRALTIFEKAHGLEHPKVVRSLRKIALLYCSLGIFDKAITYYEKLNKSRQNFIDYAFSNASEDLKMSYIQKYPLIDHSFFSFAFLDKTIETINPALEMALKGKAIILDAVSAEKRIAYCSYDDEIRARVDRHTDICGEIATLALAGAENLEPEIYRERMRTLNNIKDSLETELSRDCAEFKDELASRRFSVEDVANALPEDGMLFEYVRYEPYDFKKVGGDEEKTGPPRYLAFTLDHAGEITLADLGDAAEIDSLISLSRKIIYNAAVEVHTVGNVIAETRLNEVTSQLYNLIFTPLEFSLNDKARIFISPDGQLSLLPFEIFPDGNGKYVIEKYNISYLSSGRDLLKFKKKPEYGNWVLAMAAPDFDLLRATMTERRDQALRKSEYTAFAYEPSRGASGCLNTRFDLLPYTKKETKSVVKTLKKKAKFDVDAYYGDKALEEVLKGMTIPPRVLHLSTHGYFCEDIDLTDNKMLENPLLRSGLVLAGANRLMDKSEENSSNVEDGILTAFEVSGLNLTGTELVTLSACETGVGEVQNGEGVYGLRRAFQQAGARTILMSLWKVPDKGTYDLMDNFYKNWAGGQTKQEAFRQSALKVMKDRRKKHGAAHPYYWGAFVLLGDPR